MNLVVVCQGIILLKIKDILLFYSVYMLFFKNGGLFVVIMQCYVLGDEVVLLISLIDESECMFVVGKVVWISLVGVQGNWFVGIGVYFNELGDGEVVCQCIENLFVGMIVLDCLISMM